MKKFRRLWRGELLRPILYKCVTKLSTALALILLWDRYIARRGTPAALGDGSFVAGLALLALAWFSYLRLDGIDPPKLEGPGKSSRKRHWTADIVDFADEHITSWDELEDRERTLCSLVSSALCGGVFLTACLLMALLAA